MNEKLGSQILDGLKKLHKNEDSFNLQDNRNFNYRYDAQRVSNDFNNLKRLVKFSKPYYKAHKKFYKLLETQQNNLFNTAQDIDGVYVD